MHDIKFMEKEFNKMAFEIFLRLLESKDYIINQENREEIYRKIDASFSIADKVLGRFIAQVNTENY